MAKSMLKGIFSNKKPPPTPPKPDYRGDRTSETSADDYANDDFVTEATVCHPVSCFDLSQLKSKQKPPVASKPVSVETMGGASGNTAAILNFKAVTAELNRKGIGRSGGLKKRALDKSTSGTSLTGSTVSVATGSVDHSSAYHTPCASSRDLSVLSSSRDDVTGLPDTSDFIGELLEVCDQLKRGKIVLPGVKEGVSSTSLADSKLNESLSLESSIACQDVESNAVCQDVERNNIQQGSQENLVISPDDETSSAYDDVMYTEPFELQAVILEQKRASSIRSSTIESPVEERYHKYDTPYDSESSAPIPPSEDTRPPEEYDEPWEWVKRRTIAASEADAKTSSLRESCALSPESPSKSSAISSKSFELFTLSSDAKVDRDSDSHCSLLDEINKALPSDSPQTEVPASGFEGAFDDNAVSVASPDIVKEEETFDHFSESKRVESFEQLSITPEQESKSALTESNSECDLDNTEPQEAVHLELESSVQGLEDSVDLTDSPVYKDKSLLDKTESQAVQSNLEEEILGDQAVQVQQTTHMEVTKPVETAAPKVAITKPPLKKKPPVKPPRKDKLAQLRSQTSETAEQGKAEPVNGSPVPVSSEERKGSTTSSQTEVKCSPRGSPVFESTSRDTLSLSLDAQSQDSLSVRSGSSGRSPVISPVHMTSPAHDIRPLDDYDAPWEWVAKNKARQSIKDMAANLSKRPKSKSASSYGSPPTNRKCSAISLGSNRATSPQGAPSFAVPPGAISTSMTSSGFSVMSATPHQDLRPLEDYDSPWEYNARKPSHAMRVITQSLSENQASQQARKPPNRSASRTSQSSGLSGLGLPSASSPKPSHSPGASSASSDAFNSPPVLRRQRNRHSPGALRRHGPPVVDDVKSRPPSTPPPPPPNSHYSPKHVRPQFSVEGRGLIERVDPCIPLDRQSWYHGAISRNHAEDLLRFQRECSYLVRRSESNANDYSLSLKSINGFMHMKIVSTATGKFILGQFSKPFDNIPEMIHFYTLHKLPIRGAEHMSLVHPIIDEVL